MKTYSSHRCASKHRTYWRLASCRWNRAIQIYGEGEFAAVLSCRIYRNARNKVNGPFGETVYLFQTAEEALEVCKRRCGGGCVDQHELAQLVK